jgi:hypothetical protein
VDLLDLPVHLVNQDNQAPVEIEELKGKLDQLAL